MLQTCRLAGKALPVAGRALQATTLTSPFSPKAQHKSFCVWNATSAVQLSAKAHRSCLVASVGHRFTGGNSVSAVTKRFFSDSDIRVGEEYERGQQDESSTLTITPPFGHDDNETLANQLGIYKVWEYSDMGKKSMFTMAFQSRALLDPELRELEKFLEADNEMKLKQIPTGETRNISLPPEVTEYFSKIKIPFAASVFKSNMEGASDSLVFCFETPGGFWTLAWHVPSELFMKEPDLMFLCIQTIRISPKNAQ